MKTRAFLVSALLSFILVFSVSAQTDSEVKPEGGNASAEASSTACPYKVTENDNVYLQISNVKLRSEDLPLYPYFYLYGMTEGKQKYISGTHSQAGNQICENVLKPSSFEFYFDKEYQDCILNVHSDWYTGEELVAKGEQFNIAELLKWADDPQNDGKTFTLEISKGNTVELKKGEIKKNRYYYFQIVSYKVTSIDNEYKKYLYEAYKSWVTVSQEGIADKQMNFDKKNFTPETEDTPDFAELSFDNKDNSKREFLLSCKANKTVTFTVENKTGTLDTIELSTDDVIKQLNDCMQKFPNDHTKWFVKCTSKNQSEIELSFEGIRKIYRITTVTIPVTHPTRQNPRYAEKGYAPWMRIYIQREGVPCGIKKDYATPGRRSWDCNVPNDENNRFEIREGIDAHFSLQIKDADTWFYEIALPAISGITDLDFSKKVVYEDLGSDVDKDKRTKVEFEEVKE
ncbi:MAG: hypothetical protein Q4A17_01570 [Thermoguttaceae bacterium]|nr:hypothetical protein [Thermoguttaceae bacterium]